MNGKLEFADVTGHTVIELDTAEKVSKAAAEFERLVRSGFMAYEIRTDERVQVHEFDPSAYTVLVPALVGG